jgi:hypothetical protein
MPSTGRMKSFVDILGCLELSVCIKLQTKNIQTLIMSLIPCLYTSIVDVSSSIALLWRILKGLNSRLASINESRAMPYCYCERLSLYWCNMCNPRALQYSTNLVIVNSASVGIIPTH